MKKLLFVGMLVGVFLVCGCLAEKDNKNSQNINGHPAWVEDFIAAKQNAKAENPPASISQCTYNNETVFYVPAPCCDMFNIIYDWNKKKVCAPSGGITGQGDSLCQDFDYEENNCAEIWADARTPFSNNSNLNIK